MMTLFEVLKAAARRKRTMSYKELIEKANLPYDLGHAADRTALGNFLGDISAFCHDQGKPLISALVIDQQQNRPGAGFFRLAENLGKYDGGSLLKKREQYWIQELNEVFDYDW
jgi:hypothetical protein